MPGKPYQSIPIAECDEPPVAIPEAAFAFTRPHPYAVQMAVVERSAASPGFRLPLGGRICPQMQTESMTGRRFQCILPMRSKGNWGKIAAYQPTRVRT